MTRSAPVAPAPGGPTTSRHGEFATTGDTSLWTLAAADPERLAAVEAETGRRLTRGELAAHTNKLVRAVRRLGVTTGGVVALVVENELEFLEIFFAGLQAGWFIVPINHHLGTEEIAYILADSDAEVVFCSPPFAAAVADAAEQAGIPRDRRICTGTAEGFADYHRLVEAESAELPEGRTAGWMMNYTSGTTGRPKGIKRPLTGADPDTVGDVWRMPLRIFDITGEDHVHLVQSPLYHTAPMTFINASAHHGHVLVLMRKWDAEGTLRLIEGHRVTVTHMVPTNFHRLLQLPEDVRSRYDVSSLRYAVHGAAPCPVETKRQMIDWWGPVICEYYGASEGGGTSIAAREWLAKPGSVGTIWPGGDVKILAADGEELPTGEVGTVWLLAGAFDFEYHKDPERTAEAKAGGYFTVGDNGYLDADGYLFLKGRSSDVIITGGVNVQALEVEDVLHGHPKVADVAVFGIPDPEWGEQVKAVVCPVPGARAGEALAGELLAHCTERLARFKVPRSIDFVDELPRDPNGKLYKRRLRDPYWGDQQSGGPA